MQSRLSVEAAPVILVARAIRAAERDSLREPAPDNHRSVGHVSRPEREILIARAQRLGVSLEAVTPDDLSAATHPEGGTP
ncbi:MAG: hypothetical protein ABWX96_21860 [Propionibacteriaceae bacterium]